MRKLVHMFLSLMLYCLLLSPFLLAQEQKTISPSQSKSIEPIQKSGDIPVKKETQIFLDKSISPQKSEIDYEKLFLESQKNFDRSLSTLNIVATMMGVLIALIALIAGAVTAYLVSSTRKWNKIRESAKQDAEVIKGIRKNAEIMLSDLRRKIVERPTLSLTEKPPKEYEEALDEFARKLELVEILGTQLGPEDFMARASDLYHKGKYHLANVALNKALELKPNYAEAWNNKGVILDELERLPEALSASERAIELKPNYAEAWITKSAILGKLKQYSEALSASERAIELKPNDAEAWANKSGILIYLKKYKEALAAGTRAIELEADNPLALYNVACAYSRLNKREETLEYLEKAITSKSTRRKIAKTDEDFKWLWEDKDFIRLTAE